MSAVTLESGAAQTAAYGGLIDAVGGIAAGVLAIIGLNGFDPEGMAGIATIVLGGAFLVQAGAILAEYSRVLYQPGIGTAGNELAGGDGLAVMFMGGAGGVVLGVLTLLNMAPATLTAIAVIAYGSALVLSSGSVRRLYALRVEGLLTSRSGRELVAGQMVSGSAGIQLLSGLAVVVLGILAVAGRDPRVLTLAALLVLGGTVLMTGGALGSLVLSFMRPAAQGGQSATTRHVE